MSDPVGETLARLVRGDVPSLYLLLDDSDRVVEANRHTRELLRPPVLGARFADLVVTFDRGFSPAGTATLEPQRRQLNFMTFTGLPQSLTCWLTRAGHHVVMVGGPEPNEAEVLRRELVLLTQDLGNTNRALQKANAELSQLGQLKSLFLGMASHDLRSPITAMMSYAELLEDALGVRTGTAEHGYLTAMREASEAMRTIVNQFLDVAIIEMGQLRVERQPTDPLAVARQALRLVQPVAARRAVELRLLADEPLQSASIDAELVRQVLVNLVSNAVEHSPPGSVVELRAGSDGSHLSLVVTDQGGGIAPELQRNLFTAFAGRGGQKPSGERSVGLGLAISARIVEAHRGTITAESEPGRGSTFTVRIPVE